MKYWVPIEKYDISKGEAVNNRLIPLNHRAVRTIGRPTHGRWALTEEFHEYLKSKTPEYDLTYDHDKRSWFVGVNDSTVALLLKLTWS